MQVSVVVFDAYGTLFDVAGAARAAAASDTRLAGLWPRLADDWRRKQLEYTWLRSLMRDHADFASVTAEALDWAMEAAGLEDAALRARVAACRFEVGGQALPMTVSIGLACAPADADQPEPLMRLADEALYAAKNGGRNRVHVMESEYAQLRTGSFRIARG